MAGGVNVNLITWSAALQSAGSFNGAINFDLTGFQFVAVVFNLTVMTGGTSPTVQVNLQESVDGVNWTALPAAFWNGAAVPAALAAVGGQYSLPALAAIALPLVRVTYTVVSTPTITGAVNLLGR
jgi:hypothetical protein